MSDRTTRSKGSSDLYTGLPPEKKKKGGSNSQKEKAKSSSDAPSSTTPGPGSSTATLGYSGFGFMSNSTTLTAYKDPGSSTPSGHSTLSNPANKMPRPTTGGKNPAMLKRPTPGNDKSSSSGESSEDEVEGVASTGKRQKVIPVISGSPGTGNSDPYGGLEFMVDGFDFVGAFGTDVQTQGVDLQVNGLNDGKGDDDKDDDDDNEDDDDRDGEEDDDDIDGLEGSASGQGSASGKGKGRGITSAQGTGKGKGLASAQGPGKGKGLASAQGTGKGKGKGYAGAHGVNYNTPSGRRAAKRLAKHKKHGMEQITKSAIRRLARKGGVVRMSGLVYGPIRDSMKAFITMMLRDAISVMQNQHKKKKTLTLEHLVYALRLHKKNTLM